MNASDVTTPNAAERFFDTSVLGQLYMLMADALGPAHKSASRGAATRRSISGVAVEPREGLLDRLDRWFWRQEQKAREAYLAGSRDVFDLERRIEAMDRGGIARYY
jgi:hypothetical protein